MCGDLKIYNPIISSEFLVAIDTGGLFIVYQHNQHNAPFSAVLDNMALLRHQSSWMCEIAGGWSSDTHATAATTTVRLTERAHSCRAIPLLPVSLSRMCKNRYGFVWHTAHSAYAVHIFNLSPGTLWWEAEELSIVCHCKSVGKQTRVSFSDENKDRFGAGSKHTMVNTDEMATYKGLTFIWNLTCIPWSYVVILGGGREPKSHVIFSGSWIIQNVKPAAKHALLIE